MSVRPTLDVNGMVSGFTGEGGKTIIPAKASAKISCRLVPDQDPARIGQLVCDAILSLVPDTVTVEIETTQGVKAAVMDRDAPGMDAAFAAYKAGFGAEPFFIRGGGSLPIIPTFQDALGAPVILMGFGLPDDALHSPNEKFAIANFYKGIQTAIHFYKEVAKTAQD
jgi:acetylornithine deacetylase/succinyl-diaminopimelate desuccinylase-like protein